MNHKGFTLLEVLISLFIFAVLSGIMATTIIMAGKVSQKTDKRRIALGLAQELVEFTRSIPFGEEISTEPTIQGFEGFSRSIKVEYVTGNNFNTVSQSPTDFIRVTATVSERDISPVSLTTVLSRDTG